MKYSLVIKGQRMQVVRAALNRGTLMLLNAVGLPVCVFQLEADAGSVFADNLTLAGFPKFAMAERSGTITHALLAGEYGEHVCTGVSVGLKNTNIVLDKMEVNEGNVVKITSAEIRHAQ